MVNPWSPVTSSSVRGEGLGVARDGLGGRVGDLRQLPEHARRGRLHAGLDDVELVDLARADAHAPHVLGGAAARRLGVGVELAGRAQGLDAARDGLELAERRRGQRAPEQELVGQRRARAEAADEALLDQARRRPSASRRRGAPAWSARRAGVRCARRRRGRRGPCAAAWSSRRRWRTPRCSPSRRSAPNSSCALRARAGRRAPRRWRCASGM